MYTREEAMGRGHWAKCKSKTYTDCRRQSVLEVCGPSEMAEENAEKHKKKELYNSRSEKFSNFSEARSRLMQHWCHRRLHPPGWFVERLLKTQEMFRN